MGLPRLRPLPRPRARAQLPQVLELRHLLALLRRRVRLCSGLVLLLDDLLERALTFLRLFRDLVEIRQQLFQLVFDGDDSVVVRVDVVGVRGRRLGLFVVLGDSVSLRDDEVDWFPRGLVEL